MNSVDIEIVDEWDNEFMQKLIEAEELALSCQQQEPPLPPPPPPSLLDHSPPRELSQRHTTHSSDSSSVHILSKSAPSTSHSSKDLEIQRLKIELGRVSKHLMELEHECFRLKKERKEREEMNKLAYSKNDEKVTKLQEWKDRDLKYGFAGLEKHEFSEQFKNSNISKDQVGLQINIASSSSKAIGVQVDLPTHLDLSKKLQSIWGSPEDQKSGQDLISKLFVDCSSDFGDLFGWMSVDTSTKVMGFPHSYPCSEAAKVYHLCSVLTKITSGMIKSEALLGPLIDLCHVENVAIVCRSLHILNVFLKHLSTLERKIKESALYSGTM